MTNDFYKIAISLTKQEFAVAKQMIKDTTDRHLDIIKKGEIVPSITEEEKNTIISALHALRIGFGIESISEITGREGEEVENRLTSNQEIRDGIEVGREV